jgi:hypothetical protein
MIPCKRAAELISQSLETRLGWRQRLALLLHLAVCAMCRRFRRQSQLLQQAGRVVGETEPVPGVPGEVLSAAARDRIKNALREHGRGTGGAEKS